MKRRENRSLDELRDILFFILKLSKVRISLLIFACIACISFMSGENLGAISI